MLLAKVHPKCSAQRSHEDSEVTALLAKLSLITAFACRIAVIGNYLPVDADVFHSVRVAVHNNSMVMAGAIWLSPTSPINVLLP